MLAGLIEDRQGEGSTSATVSPAMQGNSYFCWTYDTWGNRLSQMGSNEALSSGCQPAAGANVTTNIATYDPPSSANPTNRISSTNARGVEATPAYDAAGNMLSDGVNNYLYDADGHVCAVEAQGAAGTGTILMGYIYNPAGQRVAKGTIHPVTVAGVPTLSCDTTQNGFVATTQYLQGPSGEQMTEFAVPPPDPHTAAASITH